MEEIEKVLENFNDLDTERSFDEFDIKRSEVLAIIAYMIPILFFLPAVSNKDSLYCKFHSNQALTWFITLIVLGFAFKIVGLIPIIGFILSNILYPVAVLAIDAAFIIGSHKGKAYRIPFIGSLINAF